MRLNSANMIIFPFIAYVRREKKPSHSTTGSDMHVRCHKPILWNNPSILLRLGNSLSLSEKILLSNERLHFVTYACQSNCLITSLSTGEMEGLFVFMCIVQLTTGKVRSQELKWVWIF